jgi:hypothetical protein
MTVVMVWSGIIALVVTYWHGVQELAPGLQQDSLLAADVVSVKGVVVL